VAVVIKSPRGKYCGKASAIVSVICRHGPKRGGLADMALRWFDSEGEQNLCWRAIEGMNLLENSSETPV